MRVNVSGRTRSEPEPPNGIKTGGTEDRKRGPYDRKKEKVEWFDQGWSPRSVNDKRNGRDETGLWKRTGQGGFT